MNIAHIRRKLHAVSFQLRQARVVAKAMKSRHHPIVAHIIPIRRCNLACIYCSEFDDSSKPIPLEAMLRRIDRLAELGTTVITISGGSRCSIPNSMTLSARFATAAALRR